MKVTCVTVFGSSLVISVSHFAIGASTTQLNKILRITEGPKHRNLGNGSLLVTSNLYVNESLTPSSEADDLKSLR